MSTAGVAGIDLSLRRTAVVDTSGEPHLMLGPAVSDDDAQRSMERLDQLVRDIVAGALFSGRGPDVELVMIEWYSFGSSTKGLRSIAELGGAVRLALYHLRVPYLDVPPSTLKKYATGNGQAGKIEMVQAASKRLGYDGHDDNEADALWLRALGLDLLDEPVVALPAGNRKALAGLRKIRPVLNRGAS